MFKLAIVGRPNVGKSALFNRVCKKRIAIVDAQEGITRDRIYFTTEAFGQTFQVIDTAGIDPHSSDLFQNEMAHQAHLALDEADSLIMVVDGQVGITTLDHSLARLFLKTGKPLVLAVNKIDDHSHEELLYPFYKLGISKVIGISALQGYQIAELLEEALQSLSSPHQEEEKERPPTKLAVIGRPNVGKSTLINALLEERRCVVSDIPGTTRDAIDIPFTFEGTPYTLIDTAGVRRKKSEREVVDKFAAIRTEQAIARSDLCLLMIDAEEGLTTQEKKIANLIEENEKGCIILVNKWDLISGFRMEHCLKAIQTESPFLAHAPILFISAKERRNLSKIFDEVERVVRASESRVPTHPLNKALIRAMQLNHPPRITGKRLRIYYMTQVDVNPPRFVLFVNQAALMPEFYKRYLINQLRETFPFPGVSLLLHIKGKEKTERPPPSSPSDHEEEEEEDSFDDDEEDAFDTMEECYGSPR